MIFLGKKFGLIKKPLIFGLIFCVLFEFSGFGLTAIAKDFILPNDPHLAEQKFLWQVKAFGLEVNSNSNLSPIIVAIIDEGVDWTHPDLKNQLWVNQKEIFKNGKDDDQ